MMELDLQLFGGRGSSSGGGGGGASVSESQNQYGGGGAPSKIGNISYNEAEKLFNAPIGTMYTMSEHNTGDYVGEYTRVKSGWTGSQRYRSSFKKPPMVTTAQGFAMQVVGNDMRRVDMK